MASAGIVKTGRIDGNFSSPDPDSKEGQQPKTSQEKKTVFVGKMRRGEEVGTIIVAPEPALKVLLYSRMPISSSTLTAGRRPNSPSPYNTVDSVVRGG